MYVFADGFARETGWRRSLPWAVDPSPFGSAVGDPGGRNFNGMRDQSSRSKQQAVSRQSSVARKDGAQRGSLFVRGRPSRGTSGQYLFFLMTGREATAKENCPRRAILPALQEPT